MVFKKAETCIYSTVLDSNLYYSSLNQIMFPHFGKLFCFTVTAIFIMLTDTFAVNIFVIKPNVKKIDYSIYIFQFCGDFFFTFLMKMQIDSSLNCCYNNKNKYFKQVNTSKNLYLGKKKLFSEFIVIAAGK